jgi:hypothetical protein
MPQRAGACTVWNGLNPPTHQERPSKRQFEHHVRRRVGHAGQDETLAFFIQAQARPLNAVHHLAADQLADAGATRAIAFEILPIKCSFSAAGGEANEDHLLICKHEKTENSRVFQSTGG